LKIALYLEETEEPYELVAIDTRKVSNIQEAFKAINECQNTSHAGRYGVRVFVNNAMLICWPKKLVNLYHHYPANKAEMYSWLMFVATGEALLWSDGSLQAFRALNRRNMPLTAMTLEAWRHWHIVNDQQPNTSCWAAATRWSICPFGAGPGSLVLGADAWEKRRNGSACWMNRYAPAM
jgi:GST-like protein